MISKTSQDGILNHIEELGFVGGFLPIVLCYGLILIPLIYHALKCKFVRGKIAMIGAFMYFVIHFILNIGGVSGLIPLTGVPLLLVSSGGSSLIACMASLGYAQSEIISFKEKMAFKENENNSGEV